MADTKKTPVNFFSVYEYDKEAEKAGVAIHIDGATFVCRRAGGANRKYRAALAASSLVVRELLMSNDPEKQLEGEDEATLLAYADAVVVGWDNIADRNGDPWPFTRENFLELMRACPDLWNALRMEARALSNFRAKTAAETGEALGKS